MREEIKNWWEQAKHDLETAKILLREHRLDAASFYFQQCLEKALKAYITLTKKESPGPIHSLLQLARHGELPLKYHDFLKRLTSEYFISRYPDASESIPYTIYSEKEVQEYAQKTEEIMTWINTQMKE